MFVYLRGAARQAAIAWQGGNIEPHIAVHRIGMLVGNDALNCGYHALQAVKAAQLSTRLHCVMQTRSMLSKEAAIVLHLHYNELHGYRWMLTYIV